MRLSSSAITISPFSESSDIRDTPRFIVGQSEYSVLNCSNAETATLLRVAASPGEKSRSLKSVLIKLDSLCQRSVLESQRHLRRSSPTELLVRPLPCLVAWRT